jgi:hypothetical protein
MTAKIFQTIWLAIVAVLAAFCTGLAFHFARRAIWGYPGASGEPEGIAMVRLAAGVFTVFFTGLALVSVFILVRSIRKLFRDKHA